MCDRDWAPESTDDRGHGYGTDGSEFVGHWVHIAAEPWTSRHDAREDVWRSGTWAVCGRGLQWRTQPPAEGDGRKWCARCIGKRRFDHTYIYRPEDLNP